MPSPHRQYTKELHDRFGYLATWLPGVPLRLGDIGTMGPNGFDRVSNLRDFGIRFDVRKDDSSLDYQYASEGGVSLSTSAAADVPVLGKLASEASAQLTIEMSRANAVLFVVRGARSPSIENQDALGKAILELRAAGKWSDDYFVLTETLEAEAGTILISSSAGGHIDIAASGRANLGPLALADTHLGLQVRSSRNLHTQIIAAAGLTPLFRARRVQRRMLGLESPFFRSAGQPPLAEVSPSDLQYQE